jgi:hypothetical protein
MRGALEHIEGRAWNGIVILILGAKDELAFQDEKDLTETPMEMLEREAEAAGLYCDQASCPK